MRLPQFLFMLSPHEGIGPLMVVVFCLQHSPCLTSLLPVDPMCVSSGPFDVVMLDMGMTRLLRSITECGDAEAQRLVFMGWPGQNELEAAAGGGAHGGMHSRVASEGDLLSFDIRSNPAGGEGAAAAAAAAGGTARPCRAVDSLLDEPNSRQLG